MSKALSEFLDKEMKKRKMNSTEFAVAMGAAVSTITSYLDGETKKKPSVDFILKLADFTGRSENEIAALAYPGRFRPVGSPKLSPMRMALADELAALSKEDQEIILVVMQRLKSV